jgi:hypothetical protein
MMSNGSSRKPARDIRSPPAASSPRPVHSPGWLKVQVGTAASRRPARYARCRSRSSYLAASRSTRRCRRARRLCRRFRHSFEHVFCHGAVRPGAKLLRHSVHRRPCWRFVMPPPSQIPGTAPNFRRSHPAADPPRCGYTPPRSTSPPSANGSQVALVDPITAVRWIRSGPPLKPSTPSASSSTACAR